MEKNYKLIPFDIQRAKTPSNPDGLEVVTEGGKDVRIICTDRSSRGYPIVALIRHETGFEETHYCDKEGVTFNETACFCLKEPVTPRRMTNQELSWWLRDAPEEHREFIYFLEGDNDKEHRVVHSVFDYIPSRSNEPVDSILIRSNGGEWREPLIDEEDFEL
jgi:hypothetical protein